jgi:hypothetical protein
VCAAVWSAASGVCSAQAVTTRVSTDAANAQLAGASRQSSVSADGRFVAFSSTDTTLVAGDTNGSADIFVKDRQTGAVTRVSLRTGGVEAVGDSVAPGISADGRYVTFVSSAALAADDSNGTSDVFRHDRTTASTIRVSVATGGAQANAASAAPRISGDGRYVVFESTAGNLVTGDTNQLTDVFLHDVQTSTTTRVSVATTGAQGDRAAFAAAISDDGTRVSFVSDATTLDTAPDPLPCDAALLACTRAFVRMVPGGTTTRLGISDPSAIGGFYPVKQAYRVSGAAIAGDGLSAAVILDAITPAGTFAGILNQVAFHSFATGATKSLVGFAYDPSVSPIQQRFTSLAINRSGRLVAACFRGYVNETFVVEIRDTITGVGTTAGVGPPIVLGGGPTGQPDCDGVSLTDDGLTAFFASSGGAMIAGDTNAAFDVFAFDRDPDDDGMPSEWEATFSLDAADPLDGALDPDADGTTNRAEFEAGSHPRGLFKHYLAEGADNAFFSTEIAVLNPNASGTPSAPHRALVVAQFLGQNGLRSATPPTLLGERGEGSGMGWFSSEFYRGLFPDQAFSAIVESDRPLAVERTLTWGGRIGAGYGSHAETGVVGPAPTWHFAEGATHGVFDLFYLLQNPGTVPATATITYLRPAPLSPVVRSYTLLPNSRRTIYVDQEPGLEATDLSARIDADQPIFAERAMYMSTPGQPFTGGTASAGITAPATQWFIAEGATGSFFDLFVLIGNPSPGNAEVTVSYLLPDGSSIDRPHTVAGQSRLTIPVKSEDARLAATAVSATITSTNGTPIVVERSMWWPTPNWYEGTVTAATTAASRRWALAGGFINDAGDTETYLLIANPGSTAANVTIDIGRNGLAARQGLATSIACRVVVPVAAHSRYTNGLRSLCPFDGDLPAGVTRYPARIAGIIESDGPPIIVERSTYWSAGGQFWAAGASTVLTPLP